MPASSVSERVRTCLEKAAECDRRALLVSDAAVLGYGAADKASARSSIESLAPAVIVIVSRA